MKTINRWLIASAAALVLPWASHAVIVNVDFNGVRNGDGSLTEPGPTYVGEGAAGGGTVWNGVLADSRVEGQPDNDALVFEGSSFIDSGGQPTTVGFTMGPVAAGNQGAVVGGDPGALSSLLLDWVLVGYFSEMTGQADFIISGLGAAPTVDLYFYHRGDFPGGYTIGEEVPDAFAGHGPFNSGNTIYYQSVPVVGGQVLGNFHEVGLLGIVSGFTVVLPAPGPYLKSTSPSGSGVRADAPIRIEIWDYVTELNPASVQLFLNDTPVTPVSASRPVGGNVWTVTATPAGGFNPDATNTVKIIFGDTATPPVVKTAEFSFAAVDVSKASVVINVDLNGWRGADAPAVTYVGQGAGGGGTVFNPIAVDSTLGDDLLAVGVRNVRGAASADGQAGTAQAADTAKRRNT